MTVALAFAAILVAFSADLTRASAARGRAQAAADAAALAAAQELVAPSGQAALAVAEQYAARNGANLISCDCEPGGAEAVVEVMVEVELPFLAQSRTVRASARAVVAIPESGEGLQAFFLARLTCLFESVSGLWIVSGFRTRAQQAALYRRKPDLAAPPGHSNHEVGLAADLGYPSGSAQAAAHRAAPGCGLTFPVDGEPWHVEPGLP